MVDADTKRFDNVWGLAFGVLGFGDDFRMDIDIQAKIRTLSGDA